MCIKPLGTKSIDTFNAAYYNDFIER